MKELMQLKKHYLLVFYSVFVIADILVSNITKIFMMIAIGEAKSVQDVQIKIKLIAPPKYVITSMTLDKELGIETMNQAIEAITTVIKLKGFFFFIVLNSLFLFSTVV
jgi:translation initiation factor 2 alpha subunit (eIF-2alpha)